MARQEIKDPIMENSILSPGFKSAAAMAGWDEEALLLASLVVEDTPVRESKHKKRPKFKSSSNSKRKKRLKRNQTGSIPAVVLCLDEEEEKAINDILDNVVKKKEAEDVVVENEEKKVKKEEDLAQNDSSKKEIACMDRLREELSCAICLEICFEPSTTPCGHSFCLKCLKCSAAKCGKRCPKCRQLISNARSCTINTVLWNTIQLLFPDEIVARKTAISTGSESIGSVNHGVPISNNARNIPRSTNFVTATQVIGAIDRDLLSTLRRRAPPTQDADAALALRLQREEFIEGYGDDNEQASRPTLYSARANLRAMASRAYHIRTRGRY